MGKLDAQKLSSWHGACWTNMVHMFGGVRTVAHSYPGTIMERMARHGGNHHTATYGYLWTLEHGFGHGLPPMNATVGFKP